MNIKELGLEEEEIDGWRFGTYSTKIGNHVIRKGQILPREEPVRFDWEDQDLIETLWNFDRPVGAEIV